MRKRLTHITLAAVIAIGSVTLLDAQRSGGPGRQGPPPGGRGGQGGPGRPGGPPCGGDALAKALNLTSDQRVTFDQITKDARTAAKPVEDQLAQLRADAHASGGGDASSAARTKAADLQQQLVDIRGQSRASLTEILTADQRAQLRALDVQTTGRRGPGTGRPGGRGGADGAGRRGRPGGGPCGG